MAMCQMRSPVRSELRPTSTLAIAAKIHGMVVNRPICMVLMWPNSFTICGSQSVMP